MEGKTATVVNMAVSFSQLEEKVLVVDSDLRRPKHHRIFKLRNVGGLSSYLTGKVELKDAIQKTSIKNIWILPSGPVPPNPTELLNSKKMKKMIEEVKKEFDFILLDIEPNCDHFPCRAYVRYYRHIKALDILEKQRLSVHFFHYG